MIRDPSDGSVRTKEEISPYANEINSVSAKTAVKEITPQSGLPPLDQSEAERLRRSREWLSKYRNRIGSPNH